MMRGYDQSGLHSEASFIPNYHHATYNGLAAFTLDQIASPMFQAEAFGPIPVQNSRLVPTHLADVRSLKTAAYFLCEWKTSYFVYILFRRN
jgi:hypothetical protein